MSQIYSLIDHRHIYRRYTNFAYEFIDLKINTIKEVDRNTTCDICFEETNSVADIVCMHSFHKLCLDMYGKNKCPVCQIGLYKELPGWVNKLNIIKDIQFTIGGEVISQETYF